MGVPIPDWKFQRGLIASQLIRTYLTEGMQGLSQELARTMSPEQYDKANEANAAAKIPAGILTANFAELATGIIESLTQVEPWHYVGAAGEPPFQSSWGNYGGTWGPMKFRKDPFGRVDIVGQLLWSGGGSGTGVVITQLPPGYRPEEQFQTITWSNGFAATLAIYPSGDLVASAHAGTGTDWALAGLSYYAAP